MIGNEHLAVPGSSVIRLTLSVQVESGEEKDITVDSHCTRIFFVSTKFNHYLLLFVEEIDKPHNVVSATLSLAQWSHYRIRLRDWAKGVTGQAPPDDVLAQVTNFLPKTNLTLPNIYNRQTANPSPKSLKVHRTPLNSD